MDAFSFYPLTIPYLDQMHRWLQMPHVRAFWDDGDRTLEQVRNHYFTPRSVEQYLILYHKQPIGYIQAQLIDAKHLLMKFCTPHEETYSVDLFIGEEEHVGKGLGLDLLQSFTAYLKERHSQIQALLFDPSENNPRAIHLYVKLGAAMVAQYDKKQILRLKIQE